jgi:hypothetical protein
MRIVAQSARQGLQRQSGTVPASFQKFLELAFGLFACPRHPVPGGA